MERTLNIKKGDNVVVAIEKSSNRARRVNMAVSNIDNWTFKGVVLSVSKKYITVEFNGSTMKFVIADDYRNKYTYGGADYKLYLSFDDVYNEFKSQELYSQIKSKFSAYKNSYSLETLNKILELLEN